MLDLRASVALLAQQWRMAAIEGLVFFIGLLSAGIVLRYRLRLLMALPLWTMRRLMDLIAARPSFALTALFIFGFNSVAIFVYMMTGVLASPLPTVVCFLTGMNIGVVMGAVPMGLGLPQAPPPPVAEESPPPEALGADAERVGAVTPRRVGLYALSAILVAALELPSLWFAMALGATVSRKVLPLTDPELASELLARMLAYVSVIVPVLALSATIEAVPVSGVLKGTKAPSGQGGKQAD